MITGKRSFKRNYQLYLMVLPGLALLIIFKYLPMYGVIIAFKDFNPMKGIWGSEWVGFEHFIRFINLRAFKQFFANTVLLSLYGLIFGFIVPIIIALIINKLKSKWLKRNIQLIIYAPNFISTVVVVGIMLLVLSPVGPVNGLLVNMGLEKIMFMSRADLFRVIYVVSNIWQAAGWSSIIYLAALAGINSDLLDAAKIDGANLLQRIWHIELITIKPIASLLFILGAGNIMSIGFEKAYLMQNSLNINASEILPTYLYKVGLQMGDYSYSTAVGLFNSVINVTLLVLVNFWVKKMNDNQGL